MKILVLGVTGMLGHAVFSLFQERGEYQIWGTLRKQEDLNYFPLNTHEYLITGLDVLNQHDLSQVIVRVKPQVVINCIGLVKQFAAAEDPLIALPINAMFPHLLAKLCASADARLIHISTDCVFSGKKGNYKESDPSDAEDLYGKSKFIGELKNLAHALTLRTSIIGHELYSKKGLVEWFLSQSNSVKGFKKAIFSGLPTRELAGIIHDYIIPQTDLSGLYHVAVDPISKYELLVLIAKTYGKEVEIVPDSALVIDRSLSAESFCKRVGYEPPSWPQLIERMHSTYMHACA